MGGWLILIAAFLLWQTLMRRKGRKETVINWKEAAECETDQDALHQERLALLPSRPERIQSCHEPLDKVQENWEAGQKSLRKAFDPEDSPEEPVAVYYTHFLMDRAIVVRNREGYVVCFEELNLIRESALLEIYTPGMPCGSWRRSYPSRFFDTQEEAQGIAQKAMQWLN